MPQVARIHIHHMNDHTGTKLADVARTKTRVTSAVVNPASRIIRGFRLAGHPGCHHCCHRRLSARLACCRVTVSVDSLPVISRYARRYTIRTAPPAVALTASSRLLGRSVRSLAASRIGKWVMVAIVLKLILTVERSLEIALSVESQRQAVLLAPRIPRRQFVEWWRGEQ